MSHCSKFQRFFAIATFALSSSLGGVALAQPVPSSALDRLATRIATEGSTRVIVGLSLPTQPEGRLLPSAMMQQRVDIRDAQNAAVNRLLTGTNARVHARFDTIPFLAAEVDAEAMSRLRQSPLVKSIQEDRLAVPSLLQSVPLIGAPTAWSHGFTGAGWAVAVLDTGVDKTHPFLAGKVVSEACYSSNYSTPAQSVYASQTVCPGGVTDSIAAGSAVPCASGCEHGTHVAGIAAGGTASDGSHGVAKDASVVAIQVFSYFPVSANVMSWSSDQVKGLERVLALSGSYKIAAVNLSLGGGQYLGSCDADDPAMKTAIDNLRSVGIATVIAAGNNGWTNAMNAPACISSAISVAASCDTLDGGYCRLGVNGIAGYSNVSPFVSLAAPGSVIMSSVPGGGYANYQGTSMATPHVAGAWAVLKQSQPTVSVTDALALFKTKGLAMADGRTGGSVTGLNRIDLAFVDGPGYVLTVSNAGAGTGSVRSADGLIACGAACTNRYSSSPAVTLTAAADAGSVFTGWGGDCSGTASTCSVAMSAARSVTANFAKAFALSVTRAGTGAAAGTVMSAPSGIVCGSNCSQAVAAASTVTLTASAGTAAKFTGWSGACTGTAATCTVSMTAARSVTASFASTYTLGVTKTGSGAAAGTVRTTPGGISCGTACTAAYLAGASVTLTATSTSGARFNGWGGACSGTASSCTVSMTAANSVTADFTALYGLTVHKSGTAATLGSVTSAPAGIDCGADCVESYDTGTSVVLTANAAADTRFTGWSGACAGTAPTCTVGMTASRSVTAAFSTLQPLTVAISRGVSTADGTVTSSPAGISCGTTCSASFNTGSTVRLTATPATGYAFGGWSGACSGTAATCNVSMAAAAAVTATFTTRHTLTVVVANGPATSPGSVTSLPAGIACGSDCSQAYDGDIPVTLTAVDGADSRFAGWSGACTGTVSTCTVSMTAARWVKATFTTP